MKVRAYNLFAAACGFDYDNEEKNRWDLTWQAHLKAVGISQKLHNLEDKGYNVSLLEEDPIAESGNIQTSLNRIRTESQYDRDVITGFKGEIIVYEKLISMGYHPECLSISTKDDNTHEITMNGKTYFCKPNYEKYDISFVTNNGVQMYVEVKLLRGKNNSRKISRLVIAS